MAVQKFAEFIKGEVFNVRTKYTRGKETEKKNYVFVGPRDIAIGELFYEIGQEFHHTEDIESFSISIKKGHKEKEADIRVSPKVLKQLEGYTDLSEGH